MTLTVPQAQRLGREHGLLRARQTYSATIPFASLNRISRAEVRCALLWMAAKYPLPSFLHKDVYTREFSDEFCRYWQCQRKKEPYRVRRRKAALPI